MNCFLFEGLSEEDYTKVLAALGQPVGIPKGGELYRDGSVGIIVSGSARIGRTGSTGESVTVRGIGAGEVFGAASVFGEWKNGKSRITAQTACRVLYISEDVLRKLLSDYPVIAVNYISFLSDRIRFLNRRIDAFSAGSAVQKLYEYLAEMTDGEKSVTLSFGMAELARRLKMGRSSLYRSLEVLQENGLVTRCNNTFTVK